MFIGVYGEHIHHCAMTLVALFASVISPTIQCEWRSVNPIIHLPGTTARAEWDMTITFWALIGSAGTFSAI
jgi:hypothetical protein